MKYLFEATLYYMDYDNQLVLTGEINDVGAPVMSNIKDSYRSGLELVAAVYPLAKLRWDLNLTLSMNKIKNFTDYVDDWDTGGQLITELGETSISFSPGLVGSNRIGYEPVRGLTLNLISKYVGEQYIDNTSSEDRLLDRYLVNDIQVQYRFTPEWIREIGLNLVFYNILNAEYESNAWVYRYYLGGSEYAMDGYFPQAGFHVMGGVTFKF
jgi:iron complex outermembrane receptor protein